MVAILDFKKLYCAIPMTSQVHVNSRLINGEKYLKSQTLSKHGVENVVAMATYDTLDAKNFQNLVPQ